MLVGTIGGKFSCHTVTSDVEFEVMVRKNRTCNCRCALLERMVTRLAVGDRHGCYSLDIKALKIPCRFDKGLFLARCQVNRLDSLMTAFVLIGYFAIHYQRAVLTDARLAAGTGILGYCRHARCGKIPLV